MIAVRFSPSGGAARFEGVQFCGCCGADFDGVYSGRGLPGGTNVRMRPEPVRVVLV